MKRTKEVWRLIPIPSATRINIVYITPSKTCDCTHTRHSRNSKWLVPGPLVTLCSPLHFASPSTSTVLIVGKLQQSPTMVEEEILAKVNDLVKIIFHSILPSETQLIMGKNALHISVCVSRDRSFCQYQLLNLTEGLTFYTLNRLEAKSLLLIVWGSKVYPANNLRATETFCPMYLYIYI